MIKLMCKIIAFFGSKGYFKFIPDKIYIKCYFYSKFNKKIDFNNVKTYNEKLQWLKLYDRKDVYTTMVDKYKVKKYVSNIIGEEYIIPTLGVYEKFEEIDFNTLPNQFVIKCTHDSGNVVICKNKTEFSINDAKRKINKGLRTNFYYVGREWPYKNISPKIIIEKLLEDNKTKQAYDYKIYTFNGVAKIIGIYTDRQIKTKANYYDRQFNRINMTWGYCGIDYEVVRPTNFNKMIEFSEKLSKGTKTLRVDFYEVNNHLYFGELTFFDGSGFDQIIPYEIDVKLGNWVKI